MYELTVADAGVLEGLMDVDAYTAQLPDILGGDARQRVGQRRCRDLGFTLRSTDDGRLTTNE